jgi:hypothetical protein
VVSVAMSDKDVTHIKDIFSKSQNASCSCVNEDAIIVSEIDEKTRPASLYGWQK